MVVGHQDKYSSHKQGFEHSKGNNSWVVGRKDSPAKMSGNTPKTMSSRLMTMKVSFST